MDISLSAVEETKTAARAALKVTVILNPAAGRGQGRARRPEIERLLEHSKHALVNQGATTEWSIVETTAPGRGAAQAAEAVRQGADVVAAAGGDGTYGEVVNGLVGTGARLGIVPLGTGNDFARTFGLVGDLPTAIDALFNGLPRPIDLGLVEWPQNRKSKVENRKYFINVAGCGFDAVVAERVNRAAQGGRARLRGTSAYIAAVCASLATYRAARFKITVDDKTFETEAMLCSVANSRTYGGGMIIAPDAKIDDGWFDLCILARTGRIEFLRAFPRVFKGTHTTHPKVTMLRGKSIRIESDPPMPVLIDGEVIGETPVAFELQHHAIEVMAPR
jgi:diacylglycerol kinase (ATP)